MNRFERRFQNGEIIFKEGEPSTSAFVLVSGQVELIKQNGSDIVRLALLNPGEMFGEMGLVDQRPRSATARAVGEVAADVVEKDEFIKAIQQKPDVALSIIGNLSERLRATNELVRNPVDAAVQIAAAQPSSGRFWEIIKAFLIRPKRPPRTVKVLLMPIEADNGQALGKAVVAALAKYDQVEAALLDDALVTGDDMTLDDLLTAARRKLKEAGATLLIWGAVNDTGTAVHLRFISHQLDEDYPGAFFPSDRLSLPVRSNTELWGLLAAVVFAASVPKTLEQRITIKKHLESAFESARQSKQEPPMELSQTDRASIQICYGNIAALVGYQSGDPNWYREAALAYQEALDTVTKEETPLDWATAQRHLGVVRQTLGERASDPDILANAVTAYQEALETFTRDTFPWEWAALQARLGVTLYKLDALKGDIEILKDSVAAFQSALNVYTREAAPLRWSEVKNNLGQALQVWGDLARSEELLERAVQTGQEALQVRTREFTPLLWAASQNNLGSALYLLGRLTDDSEHLEGAAEAFGKALEIYQACGYARLTRVTERNMAKAENHLRARLARRVARAAWVDRPVEIDEIGAGMPDVDDESEEMAYADDRAPDANKDAPYKTLTEIDV